jgi:His-Xaa-Ser system protein HxsD
MPEQNFELNEKRQTALVSVNPKIYPLSAVFSAAYSMLDKAFVVLDGNPETEIVVSLKPRLNQPLEQLARQFNDELISSAVNQSESKKTRLLRDEIIKQAFLGHSREV